MKKFENLPWLALVCLLMEGVALIFVTLVLVCPAPFEHSNLALIVIQPQVATSMNSTTIPLLNSTAASTSPSSSSSSVSSSTSSNSSTLPSVTRTAAPTSTNTDVEKAMSDLNSTNLITKTSNTTATETARATPLPSLQKRESREDLMRTGSLLQLEKLPANDTGVRSGTSLSNSNSTLLVRIGPLGSCFRNTNNVEICTPSKLYSHFDFTQLQAATLVTDSLPSGMSTYPLILLLLIVALLTKVSVNVASLIAPTSITPVFLSLPTSSWQTLSNWMVFIVAIVLAIASGVEKNNLSGATDAFNISNQTKTIDSVSLLAQSGTSFGFLWISVGLLITSFFLKRYAIKRQAATDRAMQQIHVEYGQSYVEQLKAQPPPFRSKDVTWELEQQQQYEAQPYPLPTTTSRRQSGMNLLRSLLPSSNMGRDAVEPNTNQSIPMPTIILDDYVRRHYFNHPDNSSPSLPTSMGYLNETRKHNKESPPFHAYQSSFEGEKSRTREQQQQQQQQQEIYYLEDLRSKLASPAPSYWTSNERIQDLQIRREKERQYMADLRKQRSE